MTNDYLLHKWIEGTLSAEEQRLFEQRPEYAELTALYERTAHLRVPPVDAETVLQRIVGEPKPAARVRRLPRRGLLIGLAAAAVALLLAVVIFFPRQEANLIAQTTSAEMIVGDLPDGSTYLLNAGSMLYRASEDWTLTRRLRLSGEGFFEVKPGVEFVVETERGAVRVLGTSFNVRAYGESLSVTCRTGVVAVRTVADMPSDTLRAGEALQVLPDNSLRRFAPMETDWRDGNFRFQNAPLGEVLAEMERQFDLTIEVNASYRSERLTVSFSNDDLDDALRAALTPLGLHYERNGDTRIKVLDR